ncbi:MAG: hypothetical protein ACR2OB_05045 [Solirubrobacteraceae bacterium]
MSSATRTAATSSSPATQTTAATKAAYIARADQVCQAGKTKQRSLHGQLIAATTRQASNLTVARLVAARRLSVLYRHLQAIEQATNAQLRAIPRPASDAGVLNEWIRAHDAEAVDVGKTATDVGKQTPTSVMQPHIRLLVEDQRALEAAVSQENGIARRYGFGICGR